ncbi:MAG: hypothetical protein AAGF60_03820 [Pseudomonadota bacterium]
MPKALVKVEDKIQLAIDAAAAANDATADLSRLKDKAELATDRLEKSIRTARPLVFGALAGVGLSAVLAGAVVVLALAEIRSTQTASEASLSRAEDAFAAQTGGVDLSEAAMTQLAEANGFTEDRILKAFERGLGPLAAAQNGAASPETSQMIRALADHTETLHVETQEAVQLAVSQAHLSLAELLAQGRVAQPARLQDPDLADVRPRARPVTRSGAAPSQSARAAPASRRSTRAVVAPAPNPFQYP